MDRLGSAFTNAVAIVNNTQEFTLHATGAETASGNSGTFDVSENKEGLLIIDITAASGTTPTANFYFETLDFLSGKYVTVPGVTIAQQTGVATVTTAVTNFGEKIRLRWVLGGTTPSFTFTAGLTAKS
ncbi:hypothetical protein [Desulfosporosinus sp. SB140]|uniref:hypothetical protein n=1 Tax=Desulfosporosinus paludis TaxID=3115649 RepID=UPI00388E52CE